MKPEQFKAWRKSLGLSLTQTAERLGVTKRAIMMYQKGERPISKTVALACLAVEAGLTSDKTPTLGFKCRLHKPINTSTKILKIRFE